jgi:4-amino-4-deoxy-L-arabinose transferase-like glycosyltransferase
VKSKIFIIAVIFLSAILRLYHLGDLPRGMYIDEPSIGYNAYSILTSLKDEHGNFLPLSFQAFGEYKLPVYIYSSVPLISIFGLTPFSVRLLSTLAGIVATYGVYLLTNQLISKNQIKYTSEIAALLFAVSPWSIHFSRAAYEANLALAIIIFASYFLVKYLNSSQTKNLVISLILFFLSLYTYNAARIVVPLLLFTVAVIYRKIIVKNKKHLISFIFFLLLSLPAIFGSSLGTESSRLKEVVELGNKQYFLGPFLGTLQKYLTQFSSEFLFFRGDVLARHSVREMGELYLFQLPFLLLGALIMYKKTVNSKLIYLLLLLAPIPAAIASPVPHALRSIFLLIPLTIFTAYGIAFLYQKLPFKLLSFFLFSLIFLFSVYSYLHVYYIHYSVRNSWDWNEQETVLADYITSNYPQANRVILEDQPINAIYIKFFSASKKLSDSPTQYIYSANAQDVELQDGDIVAISGWKGTPGELKEVKELKMLNNSVGYKVGVWRTNSEYSFNQ